MVLDLSLLFGMSRPCNVHVRTRSLHYLRQVLPTIIACHSLQSLLFTVYILFQQDISTFGDYSILSAVKEYRGRSQLSEKVSPIF